MLDEAQAGIEIARRNINNLRYADDATLMAESVQGFFPALGSNPHLLHWQVDPLPLNHQEHT